MTATDIDSAAGLAGPVQHLAAVPVPYRFFPHSAGMMDGRPAAGPPLGPDINQFRKPMQ